MAFQRFDVAIQRKKGF